MTTVAVGQVGKVNPYRGYTGDALIRALRWWEHVERNATNPAQRARAQRGTDLALEEIERRKVKP